jgi:hypothetical protein
MIHLLLLLATFAPSPIQVDVIEINTTPSIHQLIFRDWSAQRKRHDVRAWRLIRNDAMQPVPHGDKWVVRWHEDGVMREVIAGSRRVTSTSKDPEYEERKHLAETDRLPLWSETR